MLLNACTIPIKLWIEAESRINAVSKIQAGRNHVLLTMETHRQCSGLLKVSQMSFIQNRH